MPVNITDVPTFTDPIVIPADSDPADRTYIVTLAQGLSNRTRYLADSLDGVIVSRGDLYLLSPNEIGWDSTDLFVSGRLVHLASGNADIGTPTASTWYYFYVYSGIAGVAGIESSTTAPSAATGYRTKTGDTTRVYLGCAWADASQRLQAFCSRGGRYVYRRSERAASEADYALTITSGGTWTDLDLSRSVPPHVRHVELAMQLITTDASILEINLRTKGDTAGFVRVVCGRAPTGATAYQEWSRSFVVDSAQKIQFQTPAIGAATDKIATLYVIGFDE